MITLTHLTLQQMFDIGVQGVRKQGGPSVKLMTPLFGGNTKEILGCAYRGENGAKCLIGHIIPDDAYNPDMEDKTAYALCDLWLKVDVHRQTLSAFQKCHDEAARLLRDHSLPFMPEFERRIAEFAKEYGLTVPEPVVSHE